MVNLLGTAFLLGVALSSFFDLYIATIGLLLLLGVSLSVLSLCIPKVRRQLLYFGLVFCVIALGITRMHMVADLSDPILERAVGETVVIEGMIADDVDVRENSVLLTVKTNTIVLKNATTTVSARILVVAPAYTENNYGDFVRVKGKLSVPAAFDTDTGRTFDYPGYLAVSGIAYELGNRPHIETVLHDKGNPLFAALFDLKHWYIQGLTAALPEPAAALAGGITVGDKRSLGKELLNEFRIAGIVHIVVLSGYNVTIIAETLLKLLWWMPLRAGLATGALGIALFAILTGGAASIVRASIMAILALVARAIVRSYAITRALVVAVVGMVAWNPFILVHDPGFQLSVLATIGLIFVSPLLEAKIRWVTKRFGVREVIAATLGTQATVLPFLLYQMGTLSLISLPVNILVLAFVPMAMFFSFVGALIGMFTPMVAPFAGVPAYALLSYMLGIVHLSVQVPFASLSVPVFPAWMMLVVYALLFAWLYLIYKKRAASPREGLAA